MSRAAQGKEFPTSVEKAIPELFEKQTVSMEKLPDNIRNMFVSNIQKQIDRRYAPR